MSTIPPQKIRVTSEELARLGSNATNGRFLTCPYGVAAVLNIPSNDWALQLLAEWRGLVPPSGDQPTAPAPEEVLPQADLSEHTDAVARAGRVYLEQAEVPRPSGRDVQALAQRLYRREAPSLMWAELSSGQRLTRYEQAQELLLAQAAAEEFDRRQDAKTEVIAKALMRTHYSPLTPAWESLPPASRDHWLQKARAVLDSLNAVDNP